MPFPKRIDSAAVVDQALELVREGGPGALSMRALAGALKVQASSLYRYFSSREALESALAERAATALEARLRAACRAKAAPDAFRSAAREYVRFARQDPALYNFLFKPTSVGKSLWNFILELVEPVSGKRNDTASAVALWSFLHGFAALERTGAFGASGPRGGLEAGIEALLQGLGE